MQIRTLRNLRVSASAKAKKVTFYPFGGSFTTQLSQVHNFQRQNWPWPSFLLLQLHLAAFSASLTSYAGLDKQKCLEKECGDGPTSPFPWRLVMRAAQPARTCIPSQRRGPRAINAMDAYAGFHQHLHWPTIVFSPIHYRRAKHVLQLSERGTHMDHNVK